MDKAADSSNTWQVNRNAGTGNRPGELKSSDHPPNRHKFDALRDKIMNERKVPATEAAHIARTEFPDVFADYQSHTKPILNKRSPVVEELIQAEIFKGFSPRLAAVRIQNLYGSSALHSTMTKGAVAQADFEDAAGDIFAGDAGLSRCEAMRKCRQDHPQLYRRMQR
jgi:hypothetical protein